MVESDRYKMVSELIPDPGVRVYFIWNHRGCLSILLRNPIGHNEDVVFAWKGGGGGVCHITHRI